MLITRFFLFLLRSPASASSSKFPASSSAASLPPKAPKNPRKHSALSSSSSTAAAMSTAAAAPVGSTRNGTHASAQAVGIEATAPTSGSRFSHAHIQLPLLDDELPLVELVRQLHEQLSARRGQQLTALSPSWSSVCVPISSTNECVVSSQPSCCRGRVASMRAHLRTPIVCERAKIWPKSRVNEYLSRTHCQITKKVT